MEEFTPRKPPRRKVRVRITHASVGNTDAWARSGNYVLKPRPGFVPGYDLVGVLETSNASAERGLVPGTRVMGCLARMGAYATLVDVPADCLVAVPDGLDSAKAAALPLDVVTAALAMELGHSPSGGTLFMQGVSGAVGALITQRAVANGVTVIGTASERTRVRRIARRSGRGLAAPTLASTTPAARSSEA
jgi:NADPH:quinone reductase-like Zn-dependent oxidoreductase